MKPLFISPGHMMLCMGVAMVLVSSSLGTVINGSTIPVTGGNINGYEDISVAEAYNMLRDTSDGIQIPVDVRTMDEWRSERMDTPYPEFPRHFALSRLSGSGIQEFLSLYGGETVILYCLSGGRSSSAAQTLVDSGFTGTLYNMKGGISAWKNAGYPTRVGNQVPLVPLQPSGPLTVPAGYTVSYTTVATDQDGDPIRYAWDWDGDGVIDEWTAYQPSDMSVTTVHAWSEPGSYLIMVKCQDSVGDESEFSSPLMVMVREGGNSAPDTPVVDGPSRGRAGEPYDYMFTVADPDGDPVYIWVEW
ncbi:MAG: rhodanese-like domain-containing protein, partial [Thermoplasmatota archaeon]